MNRQGRCEAEADLAAIRTPLPDRPDESTVER